jgi:hypothetical protein
MLTANFLEQKMWRRSLVLLLIIAVISFAAYKIEITLTGTPKLSKTYTPATQPTEQEIGSYDRLGFVITKEEAESLRQTPEGQEELSPENGAVAITEDLLKLGRQAFYTETFGGEYFQSDVAGALDGPINPVSLGKAIARLGGKPTTNLQIPLDEDVEIGGKLFKAGTLLNTGLDIPKGSILPLGMPTSIKEGKLRVGITCALCHATVDSSGRILEGAPNSDINTGLLLAFGTNSAAMFRQTGVNPAQISPGKHTYINATGETAYLPDAKALEDAVDAQLLAWPPGNFDSTGDVVNNPSQIPSSYTFENWPYGWSGFASVGWFHGLTTLNNNVHATNSDATTGADSSLPLTGIDKETYLGTLLQNAANPSFRLPEGAKPSEFFDKIDPTPGEPGINRTTKMPGYPKGSIFMLDGLMASTPGLPVAAQLNGMSAWQNTLAPPPNQQANDVESLRRGAAVFAGAGCIDCHSGRYFTNHDVVREQEIKSQPSRAKALAKFPLIFTSPQTYANSETVPVSSNAPVLDVPTNITPKPLQQLAYAANNPAGGYKVPSLIGLYLTAPYLHDGGAAAGTEPDQLGMAGTLMQNIKPDPAASLRVLVDRNLREKAIAANRANSDLQATNVDGSGHEYWIDEKAGYTAQEQNDLIQFLLSIDDSPEVLPSKSN